MPSYSMCWSTLYALERLQKYDTLKFTWQLDTGFDTFKT